MAKLTLKKPKEPDKEPVKEPEQKVEQQNPEEDSALEATKPEQPTEPEPEEPDKEPWCRYSDAFTKCPDGGIHVYQDTADGRSCNMLNVPCQYIDVCPAIEAMREAKEREEARRTSAAAAYVASLDKALQEAIARYLVKHPDNLADTLAAAIEKLIKEK